jgi:hypothetical protein
LTTPSNTHRLAAALAPWRGDLLAAALLFVAATLFSGWYLVTQVPSIGYAYRLSTEHFAAAAMFAEGARYFNPDAAQVPGLQDFLNEATATFELTATPPESAERPLSWFHQKHAYLMACVSIAWRVFGVSWFVFRCVIAVMAGVLAVTAYGVLRLAAGRVLSAAVAAAFLLSPAVLTVMPNIRDFAKAPFILAACGLMFWIASRPRSVRVLFVTAAALGLLIGFGIGFRPDVIVCLPPAILALLLSASTAEHTNWRRRLPHRGAALGLCIAAFLLSGAPILLASQQENTASSAHDIICGLSTESDRFLGVAPADYERIYYFWDGFAHATGNSYARRVLGDLEPLPRNSPGAVRGQQGYVLHTFLHFPGDLIARAYAATWRILGDGFARVEEYRANRTPYGYPDSAFVNGVTRLVAPVAWHLERFKLVYVIAALALLAARAPRAAWAALLLGMYFTGYACLQFHLRHYFHLTLFTFWMMALLLSAATSAVRRSESFPTAHTALLRAGLFGLAALALIAAPLHLARLAQAAQVRSTMESGWTVPLEPLPTTTVPTETWIRHPLAHTIETPPDFVGPQVWEVQTEYVVLEIEGADAPRALRIDYQSETPFNDFSHEVRIPAHAPGRTVRYFIPVYQSLYHSVAGEPNPTPGFDGRWGRSVFAGIALKPEHAAAFRGLYRVPDLSPFPLLYGFTTSESREGTRYWQGVEIWIE